MTDPSSSTPASPESRCSDCWATNCEDRPKPCRCTCHRKCQAEDTTPASPPTEQPALTHLLEVAARIVRREYLPTLESCKNIGQARALIARYDAMHAALGMELKSIFDNLASVRAASTGIGNVRWFIWRGTRITSDVDEST